MFSRKKEKKEQPEIIRARRKCGCLALIWNNGLGGDIFHMELCEKHKSCIVDRDVIEEKII